jgi:hypothetical protein
MAAPLAESGSECGVRGVDPRAQAVIGRAELSSSTIAALTAALKSTDVVALVQIALMPVPLGGDMRWLVAAGGCRYLIVRVEARRSPAEQMELLGHELQHAKEVAATKEVRDEATLAALMTRIGRKTGEGTFETDAAMRVGRLVRAEVTRR